MDITTESRGCGLHFVQRIGMQRWADENGSWQAHSVRLDLMDGPRRLTRCKLAVPPRLAEDWSRMAVQELEPWARALRELAAVIDVRSRLAQLVPVVVGAAEAEENEWEPRSYGSGDTPGAAHWRGELASRHRALLAAAPEVTAHPISPAWEQPARCRPAGWVRRRRWRASFSAPGPGSVTSAAR